MIASIRKSMRTITKGQCATSWPGCQRNQRNQTFLKSSDFGAPIALAPHHYQSRRWGRGPRAPPGQLATAEHHDFVRTHDWPINHTGSAGSMEPAGILKCFMRSVEQLNLRFINFIDDGNSKAYYEVVKANPYGDRYPGNKGECLGHIQKRVGSRLRKLRKEYGGKKLSDGKTLRGRLGDKERNKLQNYFGIAIRANCHSVTAMQKAIVAVVYHCSEANDPDARHMFCDKRPDTWCKYQKAKLEGKVHIDKPSIPTVVREFVMPIFKDLKPELLQVSARQNPKRQRMFEWCCMENVAERCFRWWKDSRIRN